MLHAVKQLRCDEHVTSICIHLPATKQCSEVGPEALLGNLRAVSCRKDSSMHHITARHCALSLVSAPDVGAPTKGC